MIQASLGLPALTVLPEEDMSPKCDASSRRKALWPSCGDFKLGIFQETSEPRPNVGV